MYSVVWFCSVKSQFVLIIYFFDNFVCQLGNGDFFFCIDIDMIVVDIFGVGSIGIFKIYMFYDIDIGISYFFIL